MADFALLSYRELQDRCRSRGLKAGGDRSALIRSLQESAAHQPQDVNPVHSTSRGNPTLNVQKSSETGSRASGASESPMLCSRCHQSWAPHRDSIFDTFDFLELPEDLQPTKDNTTKKESLLFCWECELALVTYRELQKVCVDLDISARGSRARLQQAALAALEKEAQTLLCDGCDGEFDMREQDPPLLTVPEGNWFCAECHERSSALPKPGSSAQGEQGEVFPSRAKTSKASIVRESPVTHEAAVGQGPSQPVRNNVGQKKKPGSTPEEGIQASGQAEEVPVDEAAETASDPLVRRRTATIQARKSRSCAMRDKIAKDRRRQKYDASASGPRWAFDERPTQVVHTYFSSRRAFDEERGSNTHLVATAAFMPLKDSNKEMAELNMEKDSLAGPQLGKRQRVSNSGSSAAGTNAADTEDRRRTLVGLKKAQRREELRQRNRDKGKENRPQKLVVNSSMRPFSLRAGGDSGITEAGKRPVVNSSSIHSTSKSESGFVNASPPKKRKKIHHERETNQD